MTVWILGSAAWACGGFFCDQVEVVNQAGERILFREDPEGWTTFVEVRFEGAPGAFGWVVPVEVAIDPTTDVSTAPAGLFDALEVVTAPQFVTPAPSGVAADAYQLESAGCGGGCLLDDIGYDVVGYGPSLPDTSGVTLLGAAVVGPYAVELVTAEEGDNLASWLQLAGFDIPYSAWPILDRYIDRGYAFLGVKLDPDLSSGPVDTLVLSCGGTHPLVPLELTSIAAVPDMEVLTYVLAAERYRPEEPWVEAPFDGASVSFLEGGGTDYVAQLRDAIDAAGGHAFRTEFSGPAADVMAAVPEEVMVALDHGDTLTRLRTFVSPEEMTVDPSFLADPEGGDVSPVVVVGEAPSGARLPLGAAGVLGIALIGAWSRRVNRSVPR